MSQIEKVLSVVDANLEGSLKNLFELLEIPSISTDPAYNKDCTRAASWLVDYLKQIGFEAQLRETPGKPMVVAHYKNKGAPRRRALFYGHYDVQPVDPLDLWEKDPFKPEIIANDKGVKQIRARGSSDDKGQLMTIVESLKAHLQVSGELPMDVTLLFEGEEECGSVNLLPFMTANAAELKADIALICDTDMWDNKTPAITTSVRGIMADEIIVTCASHDLHSGMYGGPAQNPIRALAKVLAKLHDDDGRVTLPGFYDGVSDILPQQRAQWEGLDFSEKEFLGGAGLTTPVGEKGRTVLEQVWARPTLEINGITGGYSGQGFKTVLPSKASVKISCRMVGNQDPDKVRAALHKFFQDNIAPDCKLDFIQHGSSKGFQVRVDGPFVTKAAAALKDEWGHEAILCGSGGYIPSGVFKDILGMDCLLIGYALEDDRIHSPNEKYDLACFHGGIRSWARIIEALAN